ncbi:hypothetical protein KAR91_30650 [Candidatus Pacearchaeota archaeon]|nr:hypothetical protein [Candidatus Pacearchaeota archaeon]
MFYNKQRGFGGVTMYMVIAMVVMGGLFGLYFKMSQDKIATLNQEVAVQKAGKESAEANLRIQRAENDKQQELLQTMASASAVIRKEQEVTIDLFANHDLKALAERKPGLIEIRVNRATQKVNDELERITDPLAYAPLAEFVEEDE